MQRLTQKDHYLFKDNILKILIQNKILTVLDFLQQDVEKLSTLTKLTFAQVLGVRLDFLQKYSAPVVNGSTLLVKSLTSKKFLSTGIERLDSVMHGGIPIGFITELCGLGNSGKTQLCHQLAINCVKSNQQSVLYIDSKGDYSSLRVQKILQNLSLSHKEMAVLMMKIKVVHVWTMVELIELLEQIKNKMVLKQNLSLIIIDSLPCLMFQYLGDDCKIGLTKLNVFVSHCKYLSREFSLAIVCVNVQTRWVEQDSTDIEEENESTKLPTGNQRVEKQYRCLGKYWQHIPGLILQSEITQGNDHGVDCSIKISIVKSICSSSNKSCSLIINDSGVT